MKDGPERLNILGCPIDNLSMAQTIALVERIIKEGIPRQHVVINVDKLLKVRRDKELSKIISGCAIINADGMPIIWASKIFKSPLKERVAGIDLMENLVMVSAKKNYRLFFLGAKEEVVKKVVNKYEQIYPGIRISGYKNGYWQANEEDEIANIVKQAQPDILFLAMSSPKKEFFLNKYLSIMQVPFVMGVGGAFDVVAGLTKRAPAWMQAMGLEWFYRLVLEPRRLWKRYLVGNIIFICLVLKEFFRKPNFRQS